MGYQKAELILPDHLLRQVQEYIHGEYIYIPRKTGCHHDWGSQTKTRTELALRDRQIYELYLEGCSTKMLAERYFLSLKSIQRIIRQQK